MLPARALLLTDNTLWVACGGQVALISLDKGTLEVSSLQTAPQRMMSSLSRPSSVAHGNEWEGLHVWVLLQALGFTAAMTRNETVWEQKQDGIGVSTVHAAL